MNFGLKFLFFSYFDELDILKYVQFVSKQLFCSKKQSTVAGLCLNLMFLLIMIRTKFKTLEFVEYASDCVVPLSLERFYLLLQLKGIMKLLLSL